MIGPNSAPSGSGGGVFGAPTMRLCVLASNVVTDGRGGGIYVTGDAVLEDCVIVGNCVSGQGVGAGVFVDTGATATLDRCLITRNVALSEFPGFISAIGTAVGGDGDGTVNLKNCTVVDNKHSMTSAFGQGVAVVGGAFQTVIRDNDGQQFLGSAGYSNIEGGALGEGNINEDPLFVAPEALDFHLQPGSPCINAGFFPFVDPDGSVADMGAFYFQTLYTRANTSTGTISWPEVSALVGGKQVLVSNAGPTYAGALRVLIGSVSGTSPPTTVGSITLPLVLDAYLVFTALHPNQPPLSNSLGLLSGTGSAETVFSLPPKSPPFLVGLTVHHAFVALDTQGGDVPFVSNPLASTIVP